MSPKHNQAILLASFLDPLNVNFSPGKINWQNWWLQKYNHLKIKWLPNLSNSPMIVMRESLFTKTHSMVGKSVSAIIFRESKQAVLL